MNCAHWEALRQVVHNALNMECVRCLDVVKIHKFIRKVIKKLISLNRLFIQFSIVFIDDVFL